MSRGSRVVKKFFTDIKGSSIGMAYRQDKKLVIPIGPQSFGARLVIKGMPGRKVRVTLVERKKGKERPSVVRALTFKS